jgi:hypothetical protein
VQVKYEMLRLLRRVTVDKQAVTQSATAFGFSRPTYYQAEADFQRDGLFGLLPEKRGPRQGHKLTSEVIRCKTSGQVVLIDLPVLLHCGNNEIAIIVSSVNFQGGAGIALPLINERAISSRTKKRSPKASPQHRPLATHKHDLNGLCDFVLATQSFGHRLYLYAII